MGPGLWGFAKIPRLRLSCAWAGPGALKRALPLTPLWWHPNPPRPYDQAERYTGAFGLRVRGSNPQFPYTCSKSGAAMVHYKCLNTSDSSLIHLVKVTLVPCMTGSPAWMDRKSRSLQQTCFFPHFKFVRTSSGLYMTGRVLQYVK